MVSRILYSSCADKLELELGIMEFVVDDTKGEVGIALLLALLFFPLFDSPSAKTHDRFIPAFSHA